MVLNEEEWNLLLSIATYAAIMVFAFSVSQVAVVLLEKADPNRSIPSYVVYLIVVTAIVLALVLIFVKSRSKLDKDIESNALNNKRPIYDSFFVDAVNYYETKKSQKTKKS